MVFGETVYTILSIELLALHLIGRLRTEQEDITI